MERQPLIGNIEPHQSFQPLSPQLLPTDAVPAYPGDPQAEEFPSAPPAHLLDDVSGYEGTIGGEEHFVPPPLSAAEGTERLEPHPQRTWSIPSVTEEIAREAFIEYASNMCCYSVKPAKEMVFRDLKPCNTYRYRLESFTESRSTEWTAKPYTGQFVDSSAYGPAPLPWDIVMPVPQLFQDYTEKVPVPHTSSVKGCHSCMMLGRKACTNCTTTGRERCQMCSGRGFRLDVRCNSCQGSGFRSCTMCNGIGTKPCRTCAQSGKLLVYIQLIVKWKNNILEYIADQQSGLPLELYDKMTGQLISTDEQVMVSPIVAFPEPKISQVSQHAIQEHRTQLMRSSVIIHQRQTIEFIPITQVYYEWKGKGYTYFTCGIDNKVHASDYPAKYCCTIL